MKVKEFATLLVAGFGIGVFFFNAFVLIFEAQGGVDNLVYAVLAAVVAVVALILSE